MKEQINILVIGDEGVGKSSLISSYVSRHFPQEVPSLVTDVVIPPETTAHFVRVTLKDSHATHDAVDIERDKKIIAADSIIALYDVTRPETFDSMMHFWLPLIKELQRTANAQAQDTDMSASVIGRNSSNSGTSGGTSSIGCNSARKISSGSSSISAECMVSKPVILVGTKTDLLLEDQDTTQLKQLLAAFPFVLNCWNCSALNLQNVDEVFYNAEVLVNFPYSPIFDVSTQEFTPAARRAFLRIFRIFDRDGDNLLNDAELSDTEYRCFGGSISSEELLVLKHQISKVAPSGVQRNCFSFEGFLSLIQLNLDNHVYQYPWTILRHFDYDDNLIIQVPEEIKVPPPVQSGQSTELTAAAERFLLNLARIAYQECESPIIAAQVQALAQAQVSSAATVDSGSDSEEDRSRLTWDALRQILSVLAADGDSDCDPWSEPPSFKTPWQCDNSVEQRVLLTELSHNGASLSFDAWLTHWHILAAYEPVITQVLLFKLGYVERSDLGTRVSSGTLHSLQKKACDVRHSSWLYRALFGTRQQLLDGPRSVLHVCVLGDNGVGKSSFVWNASGLRAPGNIDVEFGFEYEKYNDAILVGGCRQKLSVQSMDSLQQCTVPAETTTAAAAASVEKVSGTLTSAVKGQYGSGHSKVLASESAITQDPYHVSVVAVPLDHSQLWMQYNLSSCDLVVLMFQCANATSLQTALNLEAMLPADKPRLFVGSKIDLIPSVSLYSASTATTATAGTGSEEEARHKRATVQSAHESVLQRIALHTQENNLPAVSLVTTVGNGSSIDISSSSESAVSIDSGIIDAYESILAALSDPSSAVPRKTAAVGELGAPERLRRLVTSRPFIALSASMVGLASLSIVLVKYNKEMKDWLRSFYESTWGLWLHAAGGLSGGSGSSGGMGK